MAIQTLNPFTNEVEKVFKQEKKKKIKKKIKKANESFITWRESDVETRKKALYKLADIVEARAQEMAEILTTEMGKLKKEALDWEINVCAEIARYYADRGEELLSEKKIEDAKEGKVKLKTYPIGVLFGIMPWNFPYYQVFRFACPNLMAGNTCIIKHAPNVPQAAQTLADIFKEAGFPEGVYTNIFVEYTRAEEVIQNYLIKGVSLTGGDQAGKAVAELAGRNLKKVVLELGGNDPFVVTENADVDRAVEIGIDAKMFNSGQCCTAAKRFIVHEKLYKEFVEKFTEKMREFKPGNPMEENTMYAPMVSELACVQLHNDIKTAKAQGANIIIGGEREELPGAWLKPTVITEVTRDMDIYYKELFGPVAVIYSAKDEEEIIELANDTQYGLGSYIISDDINEAEKLAEKLESGMTFINSGMDSTAEVPFGGVKNSGFGRELSELGFYEFTNRKVIKVP